MSAWFGQEPRGWQSIVAATLDEDLGHGDLTAASFTSDSPQDWYIETQAEGVVCGLEIARHVFASLGCVAKILVQDGDRVKPYTRILEGSGPARLVLQAERTALNFLTFLSGTSTLTHRFVAAIDGLPTRIVDTRKTVPLLRSLQKYAVRCGGGHNHRFGLFDAAMIKDNHIAAHGSITAAVQAVRSTVPHTTKIEVECESAEQVAEAVSAKADVVMLDNMPIPLMREMVSRYGDIVVLEASGGVNLESIRSIAETGIAVISVGALTHSAIALSMHLEFE